MWKRFVTQFSFNSDDKDIGWRGEYWGKMMRGAVWIYSCTKDRELYSILEYTVRDLISKQDQFGRISSYSIESEFKGWDLWARKYCLLGLQYFDEICEDSDLKSLIRDSMCRQADYIVEKIGNREGQKEIQSASSHWRGINSCSILEPFVRLYNLTSEQKYFDFASYIVNVCETVDGTNIFKMAIEDKLYPFEYKVTKAYEMMSCFEGLAEYYRVTGIEKYKKAVLNFGKKVLESEVSVIGSCGCTHELLIIRDYIRLTLISMELCRKPVSV
jgi:DUF1680 family protein